MELQHHGGSGPRTEMATESARGLPHAWEEGGMVGGGRREVESVALVSGLERSRDGT
jgi:hypothetical protein